MDRDDTSSCPRCAAPNLCALAAGESGCWCFELPPAPITQIEKRCLCVSCLQALAVLQDGPLPKGKL